mmetsp:Transcript_12/g.27  ORF Transcript_12/g.27 Transcript_12/m.27 type:complete len:217 (-) Transcript_12:2344-2994(-)
MPSLRHAGFAQPAAAAAAGPSGRPAAKASRAARAAGQLPGSAVTFSTLQARLLKMQACSALSLAATASQPPPSISSSSPVRCSNCARPLMRSLIQPACVVCEERRRDATTCPLEMRPDWAPDFDWRKSCTKRSWLSRLTVRAISSMRSMSSGTCADIDLPRRMRYVSGWSEPRLFMQSVDAEMPPVLMPTRRVRLTKSPLAVPSCLSAPVNRGSSP